VMLALARAAGFEPVEVGDEATRLSVRRPLPALPEEVGTEPYVVVHPGASVPARAPRPQDAAAIVAELARRGRRVVVTGGASETALTAVVAGRNALDLVVDLGGRTDLATLAAVLEAADAVVVGNTGPAHLAAAVGTPVVSLFAPVVPLERWHPWGVPVRVLGEQDGPCRGTGARECPVPGHPCLATVPVQKVADAVAELVATHHPHGRRAVSA
jgi:heptosyltransferase-3